jgi:hypothetical protein
MRCEQRFRAFSSEVDTGSREENAKKQKLRVIPRFNQNGNCSNKKLAHNSPLLIYDQKEAFIHAANKFNEIIDFALILPHMVHKCRRAFVACLIKAA